ncbi:MAG: phage tail tape measure protein, partial [Synergistaceae bacterium]|nr:phage tail tape measure protein [Synergistaceae bacterium]
MSCHSTRHPVAVSFPLGKSMVYYSSFPRFGQEALRVGGAFEASMTRVAAITGAADKELAALTAKARELGATLPIMARDAADAMGVLATRGYD